MSTKQELLRRLAQAGDTSLSGQELAGSLGVSRAAVHKAAAALRAEGWPICAQAGLGYRLAAGADLLSEQAVRAACPALAAVELHQSLCSTNLRAKELALAGCPSGTLVLAHGQTGGRGRLGRSFVSPAGKGVYMTLVLRGPLPGAGALALTCAAAVAVCRAVQALCGRRLSIKWVNDLFCGGRKVCGILTEAGMGLESGALDWAAVGVGLNLTATPEDLGPELAGAAASLFPGGPSPCGRAALAGAICAELLALAPAFDCLEEYRARSLVLGHWLTVLEPGREPYTARALAIDGEGRLLVELAGGGRRTLRSGEVSVRPAPASR